MSLVSLSSNSSSTRTSNQQPFNFHNYFPQPLIIKPHSQVCLTNLTFGNFGDSLYTIDGVSDPSINDGNNKIVWAFDDVGFYDEDVATLRSGSYTGTDLATEIARAMNEGNKFKYYTFSCAFTKGNFNANPPTNDKFTISYTETAGLNPTVVSAGTWTADRNQPGNAILTNVAQFGNLGHAGTKIASPEIYTPPPILGSLTNSTTAFGCQKGMPFYTQAEGGGVFMATIHAWGQADDLVGTGEIHHASFGICSPNVVASSGFTRGDEVDDAFNRVDTNHMSSRMNFEVETYMDDGDISTGPRMRISITRPMEYGKLMSVRGNHTTRDVRDINLAGIVTDKSDILLVKITPFYRARAFVVQLFKSTDGGDTFSVVADATGGNNDNVDDGDQRQIVYTETMRGLADGNGNNPPAFTGCVYTTLGVPLNPAQTGLNDDRLENTGYQNAFTPSIVYPIPTVNFFNDTSQGPQKVVTDLNLEGTTFTLDTDGATRTATSIYTIEFVAGGGGYDYKITIDTAPTGTDNSDVPTATVENRGVYKSASQYNKWSIYDNDTNPGGPPNGTIRGDIVYDPVTENITITSDDLFGPGITWVGSKAGAEPQIVSEPIFTTTAFVENASDSLLFTDDTNWTNNRYVYQMNGNGPDNDFDDDPRDRFTATFTGPSGEVDTGGVLNVVWNGRLEKITQDEIDRAGFNQQFRRLRLNNIIQATIGRTLGFDILTWENLVAVREIANTGKPSQVAEADERTVHVSIPEMSGVKSLEGESSQRYKTIKVIPKDSFSEDISSSLLTYQANYEDWIDINNADAQQINELTLQLRKPDGTLATWVDNTTRATIKFREDPEQKRERMLQSVIQRMSALKDPQAELMVTNFVGS
jgi:hypothetical protein